MAEKLLIINGGKLGGGKPNLQVNEEVIIPPHAEFERKYAPEKEVGDTEIVLPRFEREVPPAPELTTTPAQAKEAQSQLEEEQAALKAELDARWADLEGGAE